MCAYIYDTTYNSRGDDATLVACGVGEAAHVHACRHGVLIKALHVMMLSSLVPLDGRVAGLAHPHPVLCLYRFPQEVLAMDTLKARLGRAFNRLSSVALRHRHSLKDSPAHTCS